MNPHYLERNVSHSRVRSSVSQHLLLSYNKSFAAVLRSQHEGKGVRCVAVWSVGRVNRAPAAPCCARACCASQQGTQGSRRRPLRLYFSSCRSGGTQAMALLAANPAVRELLVRPLAIRLGSLRRYIESASADAGGKAGSGALQRLPMTAPGVMPAPGSEGDLSGLPGAGGGGGGAAARAQRAATLRHLRSAALQHVLSGEAPPAAEERELETATTLRTLASVAMDLVKQLA